MKELVLASNNKHKKQEIQNILKDYKILTLEDIGYFEEIIEDKDTFEGNAIKKAKTIYDYCKKSVIADDSGLCIDLLNGEPGVFSARYSTKGNDESNINKVLKKLNGKESKAKFVSVIAYIDEFAQINTFYGEVEGKIISNKRGNNGFGYDPIFYIDELNKTFAELSDTEKNSISHRKKSLEKLVMYIERGDKLVYKNK